MMKKSISFAAVVVLLTFPSTSFAEWTKVGEDARGDSFYVDFNAIRKHGGHVYFWYLQDWLEPTAGHFSGKYYVKGDCNLFRRKMLDINYYKQSMGRGTGLAVSSSNKTWEYPQPNSMGLSVLKSVCR
jgi:hypothetical protein